MSDRWVSDRWTPSVSARMADGWSKPTENENENEDEKNLEQRTNSSLHQLPPSLTLTEPMDEWTGRGLSFFGAGVQIRCAASAFFWRAAGWLLAAGTRGSSETKTEKCKLVEHWYGRANEGTIENSKDDASTRGRASRASACQSQSEGPERRCRRRAKCVAGWLLLLSPLLSH